MRNPFRKPPPGPVFDPFEVEEAIARCSAKIAEMGLADKRLNASIARAKVMKGEVETAAAAAATRRRSGSKW